MSEPITLSNALWGLMSVLVGGGLTTATNLIVSSKERKNQLRVAMIDRTLAAYQEAYTHWQELVWVVNNKKEAKEKGAKCQEWWNRNCLYLDSKARESFTEAYREAIFFSEIEAAEERKSAMKIIMKAGQDLEKGINLPSLGKGG